nr:DNA helicase [Tanacetum cinerariifolium]
MESEFDLIVEEHSRIPQRVNKLHPCYMALQFPLLFVYGEEGYQKDMKLVNVPGQSTNKQRRVSMNMYYAYQIHDRVNHYNLLPRGGKLFQQYVVTAYCVVEQTRLDYIRQTQNDIRNEYLSGIYDAILRGDRNGSDLGTRTILSASFTGGPRYMYAHYLYALAICRVHGNPSFFITFTCNAKWPEIQEYMDSYLELTTADRADIVDRIFEQKKGCRSFQEIRTVNGIVFQTNRAACEALTLISGDQDWVIALQEASLHVSPDQLRKLFVQILTFCDVSDPKELCQKFWKDMSHDIPRRLSRLLEIPKVEQNETEMQAGALFKLEAILNSNSRTLKEFGLPMPVRKLLHILENRVIMEERNYNRVVLLQERDTLIPKLNKDQKLILDDILKAVTNNEQALIFVYGHGGTGKTFLWKCIASVLRSEERIVLTVASSGIASLLFPSGRTAHSRFKIPLNLHEECTCNIKNSQLADLRRETDLIIWDEAPMNDRRCFEALDRCLRDILDNPQTVFGGKTIILGGDFRQTLLVKKKASKLEIIDASITASYLWTKFKLYSLHQNMWLSRPDITDDERNKIQCFSSWLLDIGDGNIRDADEIDVDNSSIVEFPNELCIQDGDTAITDSISSIYDTQTFESPTAEHLQKKVIVCPKNKTTDIINRQVLSALNEREHVYLSSDDATLHGNDGGETELLYPNEYLNSMNFAGLPPHRLELKVGVPIILLHNLNLTGGLCNRTRMIVTQLLNKKTIPYKTLLRNDHQQKSRSSLENIGVFLPESVFAHGQLTMAEPNETAPKAADKGKLILFEKEAITLKDIKPTDINKTIKVRVYRKWTAMNVKTKEAFNFCCILLDKQGNAIQSNMDLKDTDYFHQLLQLNSAYRISRFNCTNTKQWQQTVNNRTTLNFGKHTAIEPIPNDSFPEHYFEFIAYNEVHDRANANDPRLTGCIHRISDPIITGDATRTRKTRRIIDIKNLDGFNLPFLIWDETTENFDMNEYAQMPKPVVITVSSTWATTKYEGMPSSSTQLNHSKYKANHVAQMKKKNVEPLLYTITSQCEPTTLSDALKALENTTYVFQYRFGQKAKPGRSNFSLDVVFSASPQPLLHLPLPESATSPPQELPEQTSSAVTSLPTELDPHQSTKDLAKGFDTSSKTTNKTAKRKLFEDTEG